MMRSLPSSGGSVRAASGFSGCSAEASGSNPFDVSRVASTPPIEPQAKKATAMAQNRARCMVQSFRIELVQLLRGRGDIARLQAELQNLVHIARLQYQFRLPRR